MIVLADGWFRITFCLSTIASDIGQKDVSRVSIGFVLTLVTCRRRLRRDLLHLGQLPELGRQTTTFRCASRGCQN